MPSKAPKFGATIYDSHCYDSNCAFHFGAAKILYCLLLVAFELRCSRWIILFSMFRYWWVSIRLQFSNCTCIHTLKLNRKWFIVSTQLFLDWIELKCDRSLNLALMRKRIFSSAQFFVFFLVLFCDAFEFSNFIWKLFTSSFSIFLPLVHARKTTNISWYPFHTFLLVQPFFPFIFPSTMAYWVSISVSFLVIT